MKGKDFLNLVRARLPVKPKLNVVLWNADNIKATEVLSCPRTNSSKKRTCDMLLNGCRKIHQIFDWEVENRKNNLIKNIRREPHKQFLALTWSNDLPVLFSSIYHLLRLFFVLQGSCHQTNLFQSCRRLSGARLLENKFWVSRHGKKSLGFL